MSQDFKLDFNFCWMSQKCVVISCIEVMWWKQQKYLNDRWDSTLHFFGEQKEQSWIACFKKLKEKQVVCSSGDFLLLQTHHFLSVSQLNPFSSFKNSYCETNRKCWCWWHVRWPSVCVPIQSVLYNGPAGVLLLYLCLERAPLLPFMVSHIPRFTVCPKTRNK